MKYRFSAVESFWKSFYGLSARQKASVREKWKMFRVDPFAPALGTHLIKRLSALQRTQVYSVPIEANLRVIFIIRNGNEVCTLDVGTHDIYG